MDDEEREMTDDDAAYVAFMAKHAAFYADRIAAGRLIDPATARGMGQYTKILGPYGLGWDGEDCIGRTQFARAPDGDWVSFNELPLATCEAMWARADEIEAENAKSRDDFDFL